MTDPNDWEFKADSVALDGAMTLVLARRKAKALVGGKMEFANDATDALRAMVIATAATIQGLKRQPYEPSVRIGAGEYLAVPDALIEKAARPAAKMAKTADQAGTKPPRPTEHIETDPAVRKFLRNASGLDLLAAGALAKARFEFYAVVVGSDPETRMSFVRKMNPTKSLDAGKHWFSFGERLAKVEQPLLSLDDHFDLVVTAEGIAVLNQTVFDALFRDAQTLVDRYPLWAKAFSTLGLDDAQTGDLVTRCQRDLRLATRLRQIHESGHLAAGDIKLDQVLEEADRVAGGREQFLVDGKLNFDCAEMPTLLKLLNDDLFVGSLSKATYEAGSKARRK